MAKNDRSATDVVSEKTTRLVVQVLLAVLALVALDGVRQALRDFERPRHRLLQVVYTPTGLGIAGLLFVLFVRSLWRPLPWQPSPAARRWVAPMGGLVFLVGWTLYTWARVTLGSNYGPSSAIEAPLRREHSLVTTGPYGIVRHPMYVAVILASWGLVPVYRTWAVLLTAAMFLFMPARAHAEDRALSQRFGAAWHAYAARVPGFLPRPRAPEAQRPS